MTPSRTLGIDFGERRIGLAISDAEGRFALPLRTLERRSDREALAEIAELARAEEVGALVVGEPRRPSDGGPTAAGARARRFGERLARATGLPVEWIDESLTTREAAARLREAGVPPAERAARLDQVAAQILLQEALDRRARTAP
jgi:putative Holliday junction resolvase